MDTFFSWFTPSRRKAIYVSLMALVPIVSIYGWASEEQLAAWIGLIGAVLGLGTAAANTPAPERELLADEHTF